MDGLSGMILNWGTMESINPYSLPDYFQKDLCGKPCSTHWRRNLSEEATNKLLMMKKIVVVDKLMKLHCSCFPVLLDDFN